MWIGCWAWAVCPGGAWWRFLDRSIAEAQKAGGTAAFIDAEHALDPIYAKALGVDAD